MDFWIPNAIRECLFCKNVDNDLYSLQSWNFEILKALECLHVEMTFFGIFNTELWDTFSWNLENTLKLKPSPIWGEEKKKKKFFLCSFLFLWYVKM